MMLNLDAVRFFVLTAELGNLTRAAEAAGTVQPVVSQKLKSLEAALDRRLLERTPRYVRLTTEGAAFLPHARALLDAHEAAVAIDDSPVESFSIAASDHAFGAGLEQVLQRLRATLDRRTTISVRLGLSQHMRALYDSGEADAAIVRREAGGTDGEVLGRDPLGWRAANDWMRPENEALPLLVLEAPCGVRAVATRNLERAGTQWREAFVGGSCSSVLSAVKAGLGVAPMGRLASGGLPDLGDAWSLPPLPPSEIVLFARAKSARHAAAIRVLAAAVRASLSVGSEVTT